MLSLIGGDLGCRRPHHSPTTAFLVDCGPVRSFLRRSPGTGDVSSSTAKKSKTNNSSPHHSGLAPSLSFRNQ